MISDPNLTCLRSKIRLDFIQITYLWQTTGISKPPTTLHPLDEVFLDMLFNHMMKYEFS